MEDAAAIDALIRFLAGAFTLAADGSGAQEFFGSVSPEAEAAYLADLCYRYVVAMEGTVLAGFIAVCDRRHIFHLFVAPHFQRRGLARDLCRAARSVALSAGQNEGFTVNSSRFAVPVYQRFGFAICGPQLEHHGIGFVLMRMPPTHERG